MENRKIKQESMEIVKEVERSGKVIQGTEILDLVPDMVSSVKLDKDYLVKCLEKELNSSGKNPINALLGLMGMRIVNTHNTMRILSEELSKDRCSSEGMDSILKIDGANLHRTVDYMADLISSMEQSGKNNHQKDLSRLNELHSELNKTNTEYSQLFTEFKNQQRAVTERVQYMLCICGAEDSDNPIKEQLIELLEDLDMQAYWSSENTSMSEQAMFTVLKCSEPEKRKIKPCIVHNGEIIVKGTKFVL